MIDYVTVIIFLTPIIALLDAIITFTAHLHHSRRYAHVADLIIRLSDDSLSSSTRAEEIQSIIVSVVEDEALPTIQEHEDEG